MGWRYNKRIRLIKGVYWNIGKRGSSLSVRGLVSTANYSKKGVRRTYRIPGTGISYQTSTKQASGGGCGCLFLLAVLFLIWPRPTANNTETTQSAATQVQSPPGPASELTQIATTMAIPAPSATSSPEVRRAIPVVASPV